MPALFASNMPFSLNIPLTFSSRVRQWAMEDKQELIDIIETVYRGASKGRGLVVSPKGPCSAPSKLLSRFSVKLDALTMNTDYSTRYRY
jgi:hypothetical protein